MALNPSLREEVVHPLPNLRWHVRSMRYGVCEYFQAPSHPIVHSMSGCQTVAYLCVIHLVLRIRIECFSVILQSEHVVEESTIVVKQTAGWKATQYSYSFPWSSSSSFMSKSEYGVSMNFRMVLRASILPGAWENVRMTAIFT